MTEDRKNGKGRRRKKQGTLLERFAVYLELRRKDEHLSLRALAKLAQCAHSNLYQFENEGKDPRLTELAQLAKAFKEPLDEFLKPVL